MFALQFGRSRAEHVATRNRSDTGQEERGNKFNTESHFSKRVVGR